MIPGIDTLDLVRLSGVGDGNLFNNTVLAYSLLADDFTPSGQFQRDLNRLSASSTVTVDCLSRQERGTRPRQDRRPPSNFANVERETVHRIVELDIRCGEGEDELLGHASSKIDTGD